MNAVEIEEAVSKLAEAPFDPEAFPFDFLEAFGNKATTIKRLKSKRSSSNNGRFAPSWSEPTVIRSSRSTCC